MVFFLAGVVGAKSAALIGVPAGIGRSAGSVELFRTADHIDYIAVAGRLVH
jgi:precorrin isomerase